jgi:hypothetical protein
MNQFSFVEMKLRKGKEKKKKCGNFTYEILTSVLGAGIVQLV